MVYGKCQEGILALSPREGGLGIGELMLAGAGAGAFTSFVLYVFPSPSSWPLSIPFDSESLACWPRLFNWRYVKAVLTPQDTD